jgi:hypothetical protein
MRSSKFSNLLCLLIALVSTTPGPAFSQQSPFPDAPQPQNQARQAAQSDPEQNSERNKVSKNHIFWVIPNYRADESQAELKPLTPGAKFKVAVDDSFDPSAFLVAGVFAGISMAQKQYPHFGQGAEGFGKYYGGAFADQAIGNFMTEALFPVSVKTPVTSPREKVASGSEPGMRSVARSSRVATTLIISSIHQSWLETLSPLVFLTSTIPLKTAPSVTQPTSGDSKLALIPCLM